MEEDQVLYRTLIDSLTDHAVFAVDPLGNVVSWNAGAEAIFGYSQAEILGESFSVIFTPEDIAIGEPIAELESAFSGVQLQHDRWHVRKNGSRFWGTNTVHPLYSPDGCDLVGFTKLVRDTTASHDAMELLADSEQQLRLLVESVRDYAIFSINVDGTIKTWNAGAEKVFGWSYEEIDGQSIEVLYSAEDVLDGVPTSEIRKATANGGTNTERWLVRKDGSRFLASGKLSQLKRDAAGQHRGFVMIAHDITESHVAAQNLRRRAHYDELTGLANRRTFFDHVTRAIASLRRRPDGIFAVLFIDLDHFKRVNDEFGHIIADQLLDTTARRLETCVRTDDIVARIGGDEFAILLTAVAGRTDAIEAAERIVAEMRQPIVAENRNVHVTVSIGIAMSNPTYNLPEDILSDADTAMYVAKASGRSRAAVFTSEMKSLVQPSADLAVELREAIEESHLRAVYQPIIRLNDMELVGFEALVRWQHPRRGLLHPIQFISKAEETDLITAVDQWMLRKAVEQLVEWQRYGDVHASIQMSVNISSKDFVYGDLLTDLRSALDRNKLHPCCLRVEITESAVFERSDRATALFDAIRQLGVAIDIDDFGTGFSSLETLQYLVVDALKIDQTFVANLDTAAGSSLVATIVYLAHSLGMTVIAEGIENVSQLRKLLDMGCDFAQGFLFSEPLSADAASRYRSKKTFT